MSHNNKSVLLYILILSLFSLMAQAEEQEKEESPWYEVELIIFENNDPLTKSGESWPNDPGHPSRLNTTPLVIKTAAERENEARVYEMSQLPVQPETQQLTATATADTSAVDPLVDENAQPENSPDTVETPVAFQLLPDESLLLKPHYQKLSASRHLEPLLHIAWRQQAEAPEISPHLYLTLPTDEAEQNPGLPDQTDQARLEGRLKVSLKRYLHLDIDLVVRKLMQDAGTSNQNNWRDSFISLGPRYQAFRVQSHRRMRSGKLHFIDHPHIGLLIQIRRYEPVESTIEPAPAENRH